MSSPPDNPLANFPDVEAKLQQPVRKSAFEKQRAEAEAKRVREAAENEAVYASFVESLGAGGHDDPATTRQQQQQQPPAHSARYPPHSDRGPKTGPGSLGPAPTAFGKKRPFEAFQRNNTTTTTQPPRNPAAAASRAVARAFGDSDDDDDNDDGTPASKTASAARGDGDGSATIARPTLRLLQLPPGTSPAAIKALLPPTLRVEHVRILPAAPAASASAPTPRKSTTAIVTLAPDTPAADLDAAVSQLQHRYLGFGFALSLHRHLSTAASGGGAAASSLLASAAAPQPFGARPVDAPRRSHPRRFAPPPSYAGAPARGGLLHVPVRAPRCIRTVRAITRTIERVLAHGPAFEAVLMARPEVQRDARWAWLWDARSEAGVWYRWRLWEVVTGGGGGVRPGRFYPLFDGGHAWRAPERALEYEYTTELAGLVADPAYDSSEDDEDEEREGGAGAGADHEMGFLNPLDKAKLVHLLARLPTALGKIRKGDVARITAFAIAHTNRGVDEVVDLITVNVEAPYALTGANPQQQQQQQGAKGVGGNATTSSTTTTTTTAGPSAATTSTTATGAAAGGEAVDASAASLVGLYVVSDILSSSSTSGVRHAWRFRQLFEGSLRERRTFEKLGLMAERLGWGRMRADKWKRSVGLVLNLWEGWCVFPTAAQELFAQSFTAPPSSETSKVEDSVVEEKNGGDGSRNRWKLVQASSLAPADAPPAAAPVDGGGGAHDDDDDDDDDVVGEPLEDDDVEGEPMEESDVEGEPMEDSDDDDDNNTAASTGNARDEDVRGSSPGAEGQRGSLGRGRKRMTAADMFTDG